MKIMIAGGLDDARADTAEGKQMASFVASLAGQAILQGHDLRCSNLSSLDALVIDSACDRAEATGQDRDERVVSYVPRGQKARVPRGAVNDSANRDWSSMGGRRPNIPEPIAQADVLILVGGYGDASGTYTAANWARSSGTPILPVATFGMATRNIYEDLPHEPLRRKITGLCESDLQKLTRTATVLTGDEPIESYAKLVVSLAEMAALSRDVFLVMSFSEEDALRDYRAAVQAVCQEAGFDAVRTDDAIQTNTHQIVDQIHDGISNCGFVIADLTNARPNVYYEIGYARGLDKRLILTSRKGEAVHFDLQGFQRIEWTGSENLKEQLRPIVKEISASFGLNHG